MFSEQEVLSGPVLLNAMRGEPTGPPLLLLHGVTRCWQDFMPLLPSLASRWHVHGLDFRGHGGSQRAAGQYLVTDYVQDAIAFVVDEIAAPVVLYGHSLGAMVAAAVAAEAPRLVQAVVLEDPPFETLGQRIAATHFHSYFRGVEEIALRSAGASVDKVAHELAECIVDTPSGGPRVRLGDLRDAASLRFSAKCLLDIDPALLRPIIEGRWLSGYDCQQILTGLQCPTLLLQADYAAGGMLTDAGADEIVALVPHCTHVRMPGVGHLIHSTETEATLQIVTSFLESLNVFRPGAALLDDNSEVSFR